MKPSPSQARTHRVERSTRKRAFSGRLISAGPVRAPRRSREHLIEVSSGRKDATFIMVQGDEANRSLPAHLGEQHCVAFIHQGSDRRRLRMTTVEAIAARYLQELWAARPEGPHILCGYSFGGIIAYEMAQQLTHSGHDVPLLILLDSYAPALHIQAMDSDRRLHTRIKEAAFRTLSAPFLRSDLRMPARLHHHHIINVYDKAVRAYRPQPYAGEVLVLKAEEAWGPDDLGWSSTIGSTCHVVVVPGDHYNVIKEPNIGVVAEIVRTHLLRIGRRS
jgi:thioesterase domain-containing protein